MLCSITSLNFEKDIALILTFIQKKILKCIEREFYWQHCKVGSHITNVTFKLSFLHRTALNNFFCNLFWSWSLCVKRLYIKITNPLIESSKTSTYPAAKECSLESPVVLRQLSPTQRRALPVAWAGRAQSFSTTYHWEKAIWSPQLDSPAMQFAILWEPHCIFFAWTRLSLVNASIFANHTGRTPSLHVEIVPSFSTFTIPA